MQKRRESIRNSATAIKQCPFSCPLLPSQSPSPSTAQLRDILCTLWFQPYQTHPAMNMIKSHNNSQGMRALCQMWYSSKQRYPAMNMIKSHNNSQGMRALCQIWHNSKQRDHGNGPRNTLEANGVTSVW